MYQPTLQSEIPEVHDDDIMKNVTVMDDEGMQRSRNSSFVNNLGEFLR